MRARAEKASDGPWETNLESLSADEPYVFKPMWGAIALVPEESPQRSNAANNLRFIAQAREDIPALLASHDELTAEVERLRTALGRIANPDQRIAKNERWIQGAQEIARDAPKERKSAV